MNMVKRFQNKVRGVAPGMATAKGLRQLLRARTADFLYNALVVMVEDYPASMPEGPNVVLDGVNLSEADAWEYTVMAASAEVYTGIMTGSWFTLPVGFAVNQNRHKFEYNVYGPAFLVEEFEGLMLQCDHVTDVGVLYPGHAEFAEYLDGCWLGSLMDASTLHGMIARQADTMKELKSYVKNDHYRGDSKIIKEFVEAANSSKILFHELTEPTNPESEVENSDS